MTISETGLLAQAVLSYVKWLVDEEEYILEPYQNGREHGFAISNYKNDLKVAFSEYRNSDSIVVYLGTNGDFAMGGNIPSEKVYSKKEFFDYNGAFDAAHRICEYLSNQ